MTKINQGLIDNLKKICSCSEDAMKALYEIRTNTDLDFPSRVDVDLSLNHFAQVSSILYNFCIRLQRNNDNAQED